MFFKTKSKERGYYIFNVQILLSLNLNIRYAAEALLKGLIKFELNKLSKRWRRLLLKIFKR